MTMADCKDVAAHLSEFLDEELPPGACEQIARHLSECAECGEAAEQLRRSIEVCRAWRSSEQPGPLPEQVRADLLEAYRKVQASLRRG